MGLCCWIRSKFAPRFTKTLKNQSANETDTVTLECQLSKSDKAVRWQKNSEPVIQDDRINVIVDAHKHQLIIRAVTQEDAGDFWCSYGNVSTACTLSVEDDDDNDARELKLDMKSAMDVRKAVLEVRTILKKLTLDNIDLTSLGDQLSDDLVLKQLVQLNLGNITLSHEQCQRLGRDMRDSPRLSELKLSDISCTTHGKKGECGDLDLGGNLRLHGITLNHLPFTQVVFNPELMLRCDINLPGNVVCQVSTLCNLLAATNLQKLTCVHVTDAMAVRKLVGVLPQLHKLQHLRLDNIDASYVRDIRLSAKNNQLEGIYLNECKFDHAGMECMLQWHNLSLKRVKIKLWHVTIQGEEDVINKISKSPDTKVERDSDIEYREGEWWVGLFIFYTRKPVGHVA